MSDIMEDWQAKSVAALQDSIRQYAQSPALSDLDNAYDALDRAVELIARNFIRYGATGVSERVKEDALPHASARSCGFNVLMGYLEQYGPDITSDLIERLSSLHKKRNPLHHVGTSVVRADFEAAAQTAVELTEKLFGVTVGFKPAPPLSIQMAPNPPETLLGRNAELRRVREYLLTVSAGARAVIIHGMAGAGKTALAACLSHNAELRYRYTSGVIWLTLDDGSDLDSQLVIISEILRLSLDGAPSRPARMAQIRAALASKQMVVVIDNASYKQVGLVKDLLLGGPSCCHIIATRDADFVRILPGALACSLVGLEKPASVALLRTHAGGGLDQAVAFRVAEYVGDNPLGLIVAGRYIADQIEMGRPVATAVEDLLRSTTILDESIPEGWPGIRQDEITLASVIGLSYTRLSEDTQQAFRQLGSFSAAPGGFTQDAAGYVWDTEPPLTASRIRRLFNSGLVAAIGAERFGLHPLVGSYAMMLLEQLPEEMGPCLQRYVSYYFHKTVDRKEDMTLLDPDVRNSLAAFYLLRSVPLEAHPSAEFTKLVHALGVGHAAALKQYLMNQGLWEQWAEWNRIGLAGARELGLRHIEMVFLLDEAHRNQLIGNAALAAEMMAAALSVAREHADPEDLALALAAKAIQHVLRFESKEAVATAEEAQSALPPDASDEVKGEVYLALGEAYRISGHPSAALKCHRQAMALAGTGWTANRRAVALNNAGMVLEALGRYAEAITSFEEGLELSLEARSITLAAKQLTDLGYAYHQTGQYDKAVPVLEDAIRIHSQVGNSWLLGVALNNLGLVYRDRSQDQGQLQEALGLFSKAMETNRARKDVAGQADSLHNIGSVWSKMGKYDIAIARLKEARKLYESIGLTKKLPLNLYEEANCRLSEARQQIGKGQSGQGHLKNALKLLDEAQRLTLQTEDVRMRATVLSLLAQVKAQLGDYAEAESLLNTSQDLFTRLGIPGAVNADEFRSQLRYRRLTQASRK